jgi:phage shock protein A
LEETRKALLSLEQSLEQTYQSAKQIEESVARMKKSIHLQESRLKQIEFKKSSTR